MSGGVLLCLFPLLVGFSLGCVFMWLYSDLKKIEKEVKQQEMNMLKWRIKKEILYELEEELKE